MRIVLVIAALLALPACQNDAMRECRVRGESYYRSIGAWPKLGSGEDAAGKVHDMCIANTGNFR